MVGVTKMASGKKVSEAAGRNKLAKTTNNTSETNSDKQSNGEESEEEDDSFGEDQADSYSSSEFVTDTSDEEDVENTIGNIDIDWYKDQEHLGYNRDGEKIMKPPGSLGTAIDDFLAQCDDPNYFRTVYDKLTGRKVILSDEDIDIINRIRNATYPDSSYDAYEPYTDFFSSEVSIHPAQNRPETKASFIPSLSEKRAITKLVQMIKTGRIKPTKPKPKKQDQFKFSYDLWLKDGDINDRRHRGHIAAPKMNLPGHAESYNPPPEYLLTNDDVKKWESMSDEERDSFFLPQRFGNLRSVPFYKNYVRERFERCLELYLCPRQRRKRANVDPNSLIPQLPRPKDLQPFPSAQALVYKGHVDIVNSITVELRGQFFASGSKDCTVKIWETSTARCWKTIQFEEPVKFVSWCPNMSLNVLAVVTGKKVWMINPKVGDSNISEETDLMFKLSNVDSKDKQKASTSKSLVEWITLSEKQDGDKWCKGCRLYTEYAHEIEQITWHNKGDYFAVVMPTARSSSVVINHLIKRQSQIPFKKGKLTYQRVAFHPKKPQFFAADDRSVQIYDLMKQQLIKKLTTGLKSTSCIAIHSGGDNLLLGSFDPRLIWFDTDLSTKPYRTMRYHKGAIRSVCYHRSYPLFASGSEDGHVIVSHGMVYDDLLQNPLIVPVKLLHGHEHQDSMTVTDCVFHPSQPWIFTCGADKTIRLYS